MRSLESEIRDEVEAALDSAIPEPWEVSQKAASAIMKAIRDRLLSEEAVEAGARGLWTHFYEHENTGWDQAERDTHWNEKGGADMFRAEARACLLAAMDRIESPTHQPVSGEVAE